MIPSAVFVPAVALQTEFLLSSKFLRNLWSIPKTSTPGADTGGDAGDAPPPPDRNRCWNATWFHWKSSQKYFCTVHYI